MKKLSLYLTLALAGVFMTACGPEDNEFAGLKTVEADESVTIPGFTVSAPSTIDLNGMEISEEQDVSVFTLSETALPDGVTISKGEIKFTDGTIILTTPDGKVSGKELSAYVASIYGLRPQARSVSGTVYLYLVQNGAAVKAKVGDINLSVVPKAPVIAATYYLTGTMNDWNNTNTDFELGNGGEDPYTNPTFTCKLSMEALGNPTSIEFKATPVDGLGGDWSGCLGAGENGKFEYNNGGGNFKIEGIAANTKFINLTFQMLDQTWSYKEIAFGEYLWEAGVNNNWGDYQQPLYCADGNGTYTGYFYAQKDDGWTGGKGAFKFRGAADNWDNGNYGTGTFDETTLTGTLIDHDNSGNIMPAPGFYRADVNLADMTYKLTAINSVYVVGNSIGDWDTGVAMTFNHEKHCWECDATFIETNDPNIKFKGNGTWDSADGNWGGTMDNIINGSNDNIPVTLTGAVHIEFYPLCDTKSYCTITAK